MKIRDVGQFIRSLQVDRLPNEVVRQAKRSIRDTLAVAVAGVGTRTASIARQVIGEFGGSAEATVLGNSGRAPMALAAFANCVAASVYDLDDGHAVARFHPGAQVVMAALAVSEAIGASGQAFLEAVIVGYEVGLRAAHALSRCPTKHPFLHGTGCAGSYATAAAAAKVLNLDEDRTTEALGIAAHHAPTAEVWIIPKSGPMTKECIGWGALTGITAALLAKRGFQGGSTIFDEPAADCSWLANLGKEYLILGVYYKLYPACRVTHMALDLLLELMERERLTPQDVIQVTVFTHETGTLLSEPRPRNIEHAQYSFPFALGAALAFGRVSVSEIGDQMLHDTRLLAQADKVRVEHSPSLRATFVGDSPTVGRYPTRLAVETRDGRRFELEGDIPRGDPRKPLSQNELDEKFYDLVTPTLGSERAQCLYNTVEQLEELYKISHLVDLLAPPS